MMGRMVPFDCRIFRVDLQGSDDVFEIDISLDRLGIVVFSHTGKRVCMSRWARIKASARVLFWGIMQISAAGIVISLIGRKESWAADMTIFSCWASISRDVLARARAAVSSCRLLCVSGTWGIDRLFLVDEFDGGFDDIFHGWRQ